MSSGDVFQTCPFLDVRLCISVFWPEKFISHASDLHSKLAVFVDEETKRFYDDNAELAVNAMLNGDTDMKELVNSWTKCFTEVKYLVT